ncbi:MAG TPA: nuclear transport factor 2 family protein [Verrucomicrobiae bacterium]|nr:nuclear transport factor 2 family protein [Verrucomicrobiae bacterium]
MNSTLKSNTCLNQTDSRFSDLTSTMQDDWMKTAVTVPRRILQTVVTALNEGKVCEAVDQFADQFKFTDHALGLEFVEKQRLNEFFRKSHELFPGAEVVVEEIFECEDTFIFTWKLKAQQREPFFGGLSRLVPISLPGASVLRVYDEKIIQWSDYYDQLESRRTGLAAFFHEWIEN